MKGLTVPGGLAEPAGGSEEEEEAAQSRPEPRSQHSTSSIHRSEEGGRRAAAAAAAAHLTALHVWGEAALTAAPKQDWWRGNLRERQSERAAPDGCKSATRGRPRVCKVRLLDFHGLYHSNDKKAAHLHRKPEGHMWHSVIRDPKQCTYSSIH